MKFQNFFFKVGSITSQYQYAPDFFKVGGGGGGYSGGA